MKSIIEFEDVSFCYENDYPLFEKLNLVIEEKEQTGLDTLVVHALNDVNWLLGLHWLSNEANAWSWPPGEYGRKVETPRNWRGPAQAVDDVD